MYTYFFDCSISQTIVKTLMQWLQLQDRHQVERLLKQIRRGKYSRFRKQLIYAVIAASVYHIWQLRNDKIWNNKTVQVEEVVRKIKHDVIARVQCIFPKRISSSDKNWFDDLKCN